jgi:hypothetical protein
MTQGNKLTRPFAGAQYRSQIVVGPIPTNFSWNLNPDNNEWEIVKAMPEGTDDVVEFSSPSKEAAKSAARNLIERDYPGLLAQHGGFA